MMNQADFELIMIIPGDVLCTLLRVNLWSPHHRLHHDTFHAPTIDNSILPFSYLSTASFFLSYFDSDMSHVSLNFFIDCKNIAHSTRRTKCTWRRDFLHAGKAVSQQERLARQQKTTENRKNVISYFLKLRPCKKSHKIIQGSFRAKEQCLH